MEVTEIILLTAGCIIFILSFVLPERKRKLSRGDIKLGEEHVKRLVERELQNIKGKVADVLDETITQGLEKTERSLDRLSNEKIMAVNEYSDTVLEEINTNHKEVMFLYDMLNNKEEALKEAVKEASMAERKVKETIEAAEMQQLEAAAMQPVVMEIQQPEADVPSQETLPEPVPKKKRQTVKKPGKVESVVKAGSSAKAESPAKIETPAKAGGENGEQTAVSSLSEEDRKKNSNEQILILHNQGYSNLAIAKELGLGIGEVKLVIDLYEGI